MTRLTRLLWADMKRFVGDDIREFLNGPLDRLRDRDDQIVAAGTALKDRVDRNETAIAGKAPLVHVHARADVTGLNAILATADSRLTALETSVAQIKARLGIP